MDKLHFLTAGIPSNAKDYSNAFDKLNEMDLLKPISDKKLMELVNEFKPISEKEIETEYRLIKVKNPNVKNRYREVKQTKRFFGYEPKDDEIEERLNEREFIFAKEGEKGFAEIVEGYGDYKEEMAAPIIAGGDYIGGVFLLSKTEKGKLTVAEKKLLLTAASFLAKQMEE